MRIHKLRNGFLVMEILIFLTVIGLLVPIAFQLLKVSQHNRDIHITKTRLEALNNAIQNIFYQNIAYVKKNCYGWTNNVCTNLTATPTVKNNDTLSFNTFDTTAINSLINVGCKITGSTPNYNVQCYDGYGHLMKFKGNNLQTLDTEYILPYENKYPTITIQTTNAVNTVIGISQEVNTALIDSQQVVTAIGNGIKSYVRMKRIAELGNTCSATNQGAGDPAGGLSSTDDAVVPWVWQSLSVNDKALCSGVENTTSNCGCSSFKKTNNWNTSSNYCIVNNNTEISRLLLNLSLGNKYKTDGLGNPIVVVPLANSNGQPATCPPPRPQINYSGLSALPKTRIGVKNSSGNWIYYTDIFSD